MAGMKRLLFCLLVMQVRLVGGCDGYESRPAIDAWIVSEMVALTDATPRRDDMTIFNPDRAKVTLFAGANETISFQLVVDAGPQGASDVSVTFSAPAAEGGATIDPRNIRLYRMAAVSVGDFPPWYLRLVDAVPEPANFYDALIPFDAAGGEQAFSLAANERLAVWVDLHVPRGAPAGRYRGGLRISSASHQDWSASLDLEVYGFVLPDARPIATVGGFDHRSLFSAFVRRGGKPFVPVHLDRSNPLVMKGLVVMRQLMKLSHAHRLDLFERTIRPVLKRDMMGRVRLEWDDYDAIVTPYLRGSAFEDRLACPAWPMPFSDDWPDPKNYGGVDAEAYVSTAADVLAQCRKHFADLGAVEQMFLWPYRGPACEAGYDRHVRLARIARAADARNPILTQLPPDPPKLTGWSAPEDFAELSDIIAPPAQWMDLSSAAGAARPEHSLVGVWLSPGMPPYLPSLSVIATPADARAIPWFAMKYKCTGLFLPEVLNWSTDPPVTAAGAETRLFYPGGFAGVEGVLPSVRLKRLRRGLQDIAYLWLLRQRGRAGIAESVTNSLTRYAGLAAAGDNYLDPRMDGWVQDAATWQLARRLLAEEVQAAVNPSAAAPEQLLAERLRWKEFDRRTHTVRVEQIRSRVIGVRADAATTQEIRTRLIPLVPLTPVTSPALNGPETPPTEPDEPFRKLRATILLDLYNEHARETDVIVGIDKLPEGWKPLRGQVRISPFAPGTRRTVELIAEGSYVPSSVNAKLPVPVSIVTDVQRRQTIVAVVPFLQAGRVNSPPKIDGVLDDWPMRVGNTAGDFKLIGRRGRRGTGLAARQTHAFVLRDEKNLYVAFRCEEPDLAGLVARPSNIIHYEQLMACGEDLVEVILDPGAAGKGPEDLYHVAVKSNGVVLTERGVHTDLPLGRAEPWPVAAAVAVGRQKNVWIVEMAIPLSAFGPAGTEQFWGVNFTRFATRGDEASSWSQAPRYFYDPRNLGTMFVGPVKKNR